MNVKTTMKRNEEANKDNLKDSSSKTSKSKNSNKKNSKSTKRNNGGAVKYDCTVHSLGDRGVAAASKEYGGDNNSDMSKTVLDMYSYHRGREGMEPRDADTGELLCVQEVTDTNHDLDAPKMVVSMVIQFPLGDDDDDDDDDNDKVGNIYGDRGDEMQKESKTKSCTEVVFRDVMDWDLLDPSTPSPIAFATSIAKEYGLTFGRTMDLAASIEQQIETHLNANFRYSEPVAVKDTEGNLGRDRQPGPVRETFRYDQVIEAGKEGFIKPQQLRMIGRSRHTSCGQSKSKGGVASEADSIAGETASNRYKRRGSLESGTSGGESDTGADGDEIEDKLVEEVKKRSRAASVLDIGRQSSNGMVGKLERLSNAHCHICHKRCDVGYRFACGLVNHVYCESHLKVSYCTNGITKDNFGRIFYLTFCFFFFFLCDNLYQQSRLGITDDFVFDYCPICSLLCGCAKCGRRVVSIAKILKAKCIEQQKEAQDTDFPEIFEICSQGQSAPLLRDLLKDAASTFRKQKLEELEKQRHLKPSPPKPPKMSNGILQKRTFQRKDQMMVPKPPLVDFPTEIYNGVELEVATARDYFTIFSSAGQKLTNDLPDAWLEDRTEVLSASSTSQKETDVPEDGNVDYCQYCRTPGDIICCDFCPRAFHLHCMKKAGSQTDTTNTHGDRWQCYICRKEKDPLDDDLVDGKKSMDLITPFFMTVDPTDDTYLIGVEVLSMIHDMITKLMDYDFGYMFSEPVDMDAVPDYKLIVKNPMDLGTICSMLINGDYYKPLAKGCSMDDIVAKVLKDLELVWHNCFTYNYEGSAVYRMAEVLRRRGTMIRKRSFNHKLSEKVKIDVEKFVLDMENARVTIYERCSAEGRKSP